ncbi:MAG: serine protease [Planctomycetota bacterium]
MLWGWDSSGPARAVWTPQNLADYLLTGQTPHPAVARIIAPESSSTSLGSGVLVDVNRTQGLVLTNWHVVRDSRSAVLVQFPDGFQSAGTVVRWDEAWDLAALVIWKPRATPVTIASAPPAIGDTLTIAGFGRGPYREETGPCLDYLSPSTGYPREFVELKATARQGDSGGPIFNDRGELAGVLFGQTEGRTIGSCSTRVRAFLAAVGSGGFVPTPIAEFSDARAIDRGIGLASAPVDRLADAGDLPLERSTEVDAAPSLPPARGVIDVAMQPEAMAGPAFPGGPAAASSLPDWAAWLGAGPSSRPDFLAAAGGLALVVLGLRVLLGGRRHEPLG